MDMLLTQYQDNGRGPVFFDCSGLVIEVCDRMNWPVPHFPTDMQAADKRLLFRDQLRNREWRQCDPVDGVVAFFGRMAAGRHVGIVINGGILQTEEAQYQDGILIKASGPSWYALSHFEGQRIEYARWVS